MHVHHVFPYDPRRLHLDVDRWWSGQLRRWPLAAVTRSAHAERTTVHVIGRRSRRVTTGPVPLHVHGTAYDNVRHHGWGDDWSASLRRAVACAGADDAVVVHLDDYAAARLTLRAGAGARRVVVLHGRGTGRPDGHLSNADGIVVLHDRGRAELEQQGLAARTTSVIPSVDRSLFSAAGGGPADADLVVGFVGRLEESKGVHDLAASVRALAADGLPVRVEAVGSGTTLDQRRFEAGLTGVRVSLLGERPPEEVARRMASWSVLALPSYTEGFPLVALEALACGTPVAGVEGVLPSRLVDADGVVVGPRADYGRVLVEAAARPRPSAEWVPDHAEGAATWDRLLDGLPAWRAHDRLSPRPLAGRLRRARLRRPPA